MNLTEQTARAGLPARWDQDEVTSDNPGHEIKAGALIALAFFGVFLGWSFIAHLDAAAVAQGAISVAGHRQTVQHKDGGIVSAIYVKEGQHVKAGQVLIDLAPADVEALERSMAAQVIGLQAQRARLYAERLGLPAIETPAEFANLTGYDKEEADRALKMQTIELNAGRRAVGGQKAVLAQRSAQISRQIEGFNQQAHSTDDQSRLINDELQGTRDLAGKGYASVNRVRALERTAAGLAGSRAELDANAARAREQIGETRMQAASLDSDRAEQVAKEMRDVEFQLNDLLPKLSALKEQLAGTSIRAPATGQVVGLTIFTVGGVIAPGQHLLDVVPDMAPLVIEAQVNPSDAGDLYVGQETEVKIASLHDRQIPILKGELTRVSADSFTDEKSGARYFTAEVTVPISQLQTLSTKTGTVYKLKPGLPVQIMVPLRKRTAFQYLTEPLTSALWRSFREH